MAKKIVNTNLVVALLVVIAVLGYGLIGKAGNLEPSAAPTPTMKTLDEVEPRIPLVPGLVPLGADYQILIDEPGSYYLTQNITINFRHAIKITASGVTLDLMGFRLYSSWTSPIPIGTNLNFDGIYIEPSVTKGTRECN